MESIIQLINENEWEKAAEEVLQKLEKKEFNDTLAILAATVNEHFGDDEMVVSFVTKGLRYNYKNYELYMLLGNYYAKRNINQAYLCYENAEYFCGINGNRADYDYISQMKEAFADEYHINVPAFSFVILSHNKMDAIKDCISSIRKTCKEDIYEIIVVDNASTDGSREWLLSQENITLICNDENVKDAVGYNQGINAALENTDIMLLSADAVMMPNAMFTLRLGLYASDKNGAAGSATNHSIQKQMIESKFTQMSEYIEYCEKNNLPGDLCEYRPMLDGFAMLIKRKVLNMVWENGLDENLTLYEDIDMGMRMLSHGYRNVLCWNSFIFCREKQWVIDAEKMQESETILKKKWGINPAYYANSRMDLISLIAEDENAKIRVLEVGCGLGATLGAIKYKYPNACVYGVELVENVARLGSANFDIICADVEEAILPFEEDFFDYIIFGDVLEHLKYPEEVLKIMKKYLKHNGCVLASIPNVMNAENIYQLLHGFFTYEDSGIRDKTHLRFFTYSEIVNMLQRAGYRMVGISGTYCNGLTTDDFKEFFDMLLNIPGVAERQYFDILQYLVCAEKI
ncbi:MAG: methyltransferase domain-containing protein [Muribaculaceae bacterium]|nr:methyltransferase domain-containing protein [Muribaculaceae bacterium]MCM1398947.1 methyltransferase domain-containing protein [Clostridium sp.]MCM1458805.1 methyltransferase domain-containing protein [Bacteroides sp.]